MTVVRIPDITTATSQEELAELASLAEGKTVLEIGSFLGASTVTMAQSAKRVYAVDWHRGDIHHSPDTETMFPFLQNLIDWDVRHKVIPMIGRCEHVLPVLRPASFDLVFVDGVHTKEGTYRDGGYALNLVRPDGVVAFHDYGVHGVTPAIEELGLEPDRIVGTIAICESKTSKERR